MSGIIKASNTLDIVEIIPNESGSSLTWTVNKLSQSPNPDERPCEQLKLLINKQGTVSGSVFKTDIGYKRSLPFLKVDPNKSDQFNHLSDCGDGGNIYDPDINDLIKCDKIVCMNNMDPDISIEQEAMVQCGIKYHLHKVFYHTKGNENYWCKSKYPNDDTIESKSLIDTLIDQGSDKEEAIKISNSYNPRVRAYPYFGDIEKEIYKIPQYKEFKDRGLLNFKGAPKSFKDLQGELKTVYSAIRKCKFVIADPKKNCQNKLITPWDIYQNMIDLGYIKQEKGSNEMTEKQNKKEENAEESTSKSEEKEEENIEETSATINSKKASLIIVIVVTLLTGCLSFYIYISHD